MQATINQASATSTASQDLLVAIYNQATYNAPPSDWTPTSQTKTAPTKSCSWACHFRISGNVLGDVSSVFGVASSALAVAAVVALVVCPVLAPELALGAAATGLASTGFAAAAAGADLVGGDEDGALVNGSGAALGIILAGTGGAVASGLGREAGGYLAKGLVGRLIEKGSEQAVDASAGRYTAGDADRTNLRAETAAGGFGTVLGAVGFDFSPYTDQGPTKL